MPTPPKEGETRQQFMSRCMSVMHGEKDRPKEQQVAICFSMWRKVHPSDKGTKATESSEDAAKKKKKRKGGWNG